MILSIKSLKRPRAPIYPRSAFSTIAGLPLYNVLESAANAACRLRALTSIPDGSILLKLFGPPKMSERKDVDGSSSWGSARADRKRIRLPPSLQSMPIQILLMIANWSDTFSSGLKLSQPASWILIAPALAFKIWLRSVPQSDQKQEARHANNNSSMPHTQPLFPDQSKGSYIRLSRRGVTP